MAKSVLSLTGKVGIVRTDLNNNITWEEETSNAIVGTTRDQLVLALNSLSYDWDGSSTASDQIAFYSYTDSTNYHSTDLRAGASGSTINFSPPISVIATENTDGAWAILTSASAAPPILANHN